MGELTLGVHDVGRGFAFLGAHPRLWRWVLAPAVITLVLLGALVVGVARLATGLVTAVTSHLPAWLEGAASTLLLILVVIVLAAGALLVFVALAGVVAGPFCERLSEAVEEILTGRAGPPFDFGHRVREIAIGVGHMLRRVIVAVLGAGFLFALSFVPIIGSLAAVALGGYFAARAAAYDCYDAVLGRRSLAYREKLAILSAHRSRSLGLGIGVVGLLLVPGLNLVALGVGSIGATLAMHELAPAAAPPRA